MGNAYGDALSLSSAYQKSLQYDAQLRAAQADNRAQKEEVEKAFSRFLPNVTLSSSRGRGIQDRTQSSYPTVHSVYDSYSHSLSVRQSIVNMANLATYRQATSLAARGDLLLQKEQSDLFPRVANAYLNVLYSLDNIGHARALKQSTLNQLASAEKRFHVGQGTITEISEAKASSEKAIAEERSWMNTLELSRHDLELIVGELPTEIMKLDSSKSPDQVSVIMKEDEWINRVVQTNSEILASKQEVEAAGFSLDQAKAGHYPTLDFVASRVRSESDNNYSIGTAYDTTNLMMQLNVPIYSGGYVNSAVRQAVDKLEAANEKLDLKIRTVTASARKFYSSLDSGIAQLRALKEVVKANEIALIGTRKGFEYGARTNVEVLNAEEKLFQSLTELSKARYAYLNDLISLYAISEMVKPEEIDKVSSWFTQAQSLQVLE